MFVCLPFVPKSKWLFPFWAIVLLVIALVMWAAIVAWSMLRAMFLYLTDWLGAPREWCEHFIAGMGQLFTWLILPWILVILGMAGLRISRFFRKLLSPFRYLRKNGSDMLCFAANFIAFALPTLIIACAASFVRTDERRALDSYWEARNL